MEYSVKWVYTDRPFEKRFERYLDDDFFEHQIHWFSLFNSFMMVVFLVGFVALILMRALKQDYERIRSEEDEMEIGHVVDETGWKQCHQDVFRKPSYLSMFSAVVGTGAQIFTLFMGVIVYAALGEVYTGR